MHDVLVRDVRVREHDLVDLVLAYELLERVLGDDRNAVGIERAGELGRVAPPFDVRDLRRRERDDLVLLPAAVDEVEVVEVAARGACDQDSSPVHA